MLGSVIVGNPRRSGRQMPGQGLKQNLEAPGDSGDSGSLKAAELMAGQETAVHINGALTTGPSVPWLPIVGSSPGGGCVLSSVCGDSLELLATWQCETCERAPADRFCLFLIPSPVLLSVAGCDSVILSDSFQHSSLLF